MRERLWIKGKMMKNSIFDTLSLRCVLDIQVEILKQEVIYMNLEFMEEVQDDRSSKMKTKN